MSCTPSALPKGKETPSIPIHSETDVPTLNVEACPPDHLIYDLHAPENMNELIGQYFSYPIPQPTLEEVRFKLMRFLNSSSSYVLTQIDVGNKSTLMLGKIACDEKIDPASPQTYGFYLIKSLTLLPDGNEYESKKPQRAWRVDELTESIEEMETDNVECWFGGAF